MEKIETKPVAAVALKSNGFVTIRGVRAWTAGVLGENTVFLALVALAAVLRFVRLGHQDLWVDEMLTMQDSINLDVSRVFHRTHGLSFLLYKAILQYNDSEAFLRFPSALFGVLTLFPVYWLLRRGLTKRQSLFCIGLLAILPFHIVYSMEARYYAMITFFSALALVFLTRFCLGGSLLSLIFFGIVQLLAYFCHPASAPAALGAALAGGIWVGINHRVWWTEFRTRQAAQEARWGVIWVRGLLILKILILLLMVGGGIKIVWEQQVRAVLARWSSPLPPGIAANGQFLWAHLAGFVQVRWATSLPWVPAVGGWVACLGAVALWWRSRYLALLFTLLYGFGLGFLFLSRAEIPYVNKYSSALYPAFVGWMGYGIWTLGSGIARLFSRPHATRWAWAFLGIFALLFSVTLHSQYTKQLMPLRATHHFVLERSPAEPPPCIIAFGMTEMCLKHYRTAETPMVLGWSTYLESGWSEEALNRFLTAMTHSRVPVWVASFKQEAAAVEARLPKTRWMKITELESLSPHQYSVVLWSARPSAQQETPKPRPSPPWGMRYEAEAFDTIFPLRAGIVSRQEEEYLSFTYSAACEYAVDLPGPTRTVFRLVGRNFAQYSRLVEIRLDERTLGMVTFDPQQDSFTTLTLILNAPPGSHTLELTPLNSTLPIGFTPTPKDRLELDCFYLDAIENAPDTPVRSNDILSQVELVDIPPLYQRRFTVPGNPTALLQGWEIHPENASWKATPGQQGNPEILTVEIPKNQKISSVMSAGFDCNPMQLLYGSMEMRTDNLYTHASNIRFTFYDKNKNPVQSFYAASGSLSGDTRWRRYAFLGLVPAEGRYVNVSADVWRVSEPSRLTDGRILLRNLQIGLPVAP